MTTIELLQKEMANEANVTRKMLSLVPNDKLDWQPHAKSMTVRQLATHIAEIPSWIPFIIATSEIDFAVMPQVERKETTADILSFFETNLTDATAALGQVTTAQLDETWTMRFGDHIISTDLKWESIRHAFCQTVHHRAQLGVYLRLLDIPLPGTYGPSADDSKGF